jgi:hypothetical protein
MGLPTLLELWDLAYDPAQDCARGDADTEFPGQFGQIPVARVVPREDVIADPIDFAPVTDQNITRSAWRGEQLTRLFLVEYCPKL